MPLQPPVPYAWHAGSPVPSFVDFNSGIRDAWNYLATNIIFRGRGTASQSVASGTWTAINLQTADEDNYSGWSSGTPSIYTVQVAGVYTVNVGAYLSGTSSTTASGASGIGVTPLGSTLTIYYTGEAYVASDSNPWCIPGSMTAYFGTGDKISLYTWQNAGALTTATATGTQSWMDIYWETSG